MIREVVGIRLGGAGVLALIPIALLLPGLLRKPPSPYSLYSGLNCDVYLEECPQVEPGPFQMEVNEAGSPSIPSDMLPMWEVGFSRVCCDVHPRSYLSLCVGLAFLGDDRCNVREQGDGVVGPVLGDVQYADEIERMSQPGAIVYVSQGQLLQFVDAFVQLPPTASLILVTGHTDCSFPRQQWGEGVDNRLCFLIDSKEDVEARIHYTELIQDSRLRHWFTQNYDLTGCNAASGCSPWSRDQGWTRKVSPIPIGLGGFQRYAEDFYIIKAHERKSMRRQVSDLLDVRARLPRFDLKQEKLLLAFAPAHIHRALLLEYLGGRPYVERYAALNWQNTEVEYSDRLNYWRALGEHMFVAAPTGQGMDTYRLWEALFLGSVPVVESSALDLLYRDLPVIIIESWGSINATSLANWKLEIAQRFGPEPFAHVQEKLTMRYWVDLVQQAAKSSRVHSPLDLGQNNVMCESPIVSFCSSVFQGGAAK
mmetsp:Transcript_39126/g.112962  ORF Transcript_39126/g.112962 Transcript_39126/m.112962 type:complete len:480 (+) Transcript_39126:42-1481(+)